MVVPLTTMLFITNALIHLFSFSLKCHTIKIRWYFFSSDKNQIFAALNIVQEDVLRIMNNHKNGYKQIH